ncbi:MAG: cation diffusion facilitator family transporter [Nannocystis sp.]|uniref:cation diffusion facilitator family transporter n=1 Tax=Nannocystis sp. TaxID=1962667 RepID=UPI0024250294|nr:cation diffusion facilitator family transporter [Nannocystis sp.]MBK9754895.1 cation diffusion facilitator family transporter [Nannocystis sp.]
MAEDHSTSHIIQSLMVNLIIAAAKGVAALLSGSGSMLAETLHSFADCGNQLLLLLGVKKSRHAPTAAHPLGYGRALYFWSFMVALLLFTGGGVFSIYESIHKLGHPEPVGDMRLALAILGFSLVLEGWATLKNVQELNKRRKGRPFFRFLSDSKDSDLVVVFGENAAAVLGLGIALLAITLAALTGDGSWDAIGSLFIGVVLIGVALFLAIEVKSLIIGEAADPEIAEAVTTTAAEDPRLTRVLHMITIQQGPAEVLLIMKASFAPGLSVEDVARAINDFEDRLRGRCPEVRWSFIEPDVPRS